ncbi:MAG: ABC transporter permease [Tepidisphaerales bacterium]
MYRTWVIARHTFTEAVLQPIYSLMILLGAAVLAVFGGLPFFTFGEDTLMFTSVSLDVILLFVLISTLFVTSRSIYEEIEDRTMLTLMSKPVARWEVMVGKYAGIIAAAALAMAALAVVLALATWWRIPTDYQIRAATVSDVEARNLWETRMMHLAGLVPSIVVIWLQVCVLAAIGVAISTRFSLVVNLPTVIIIYFAGNLIRFLPEVATGVLTKGLLYLSYLLPFLSVFDLKSQAVLSPIALPGTQFEGQFNAVSLGFLWTNVALAALYAATYATFALALGLYFFRHRELGGSEG